MSEMDVLAFAERLLSLIDTTRYTATYKLATLIALIDLVGEHTGPGAEGPLELSGLDVGHRVVELYWPQTTPYALGSDGPAVLVQSRTNDIPTKLTAWREEHALGAGASIEDARAVDPRAWDQLRSQLAAIVVGMPLAKLQRFGEGGRSVEERFLFDFPWPDEVKPKTVLRAGFDDTIRFRDGVAELLVRLGPLLRPVIQARWAEEVAARNTDVVDAHQLTEFLFGASRTSLDRIRGPLADLQDGRCFYCDRPVGRSPVVDHFLPWSRHPDNTLDNLVVADAGCNGSKSASLAGVEHLGRWVHRGDGGSSTDADLSEIAARARWPRRRARTVAAARASYLWLPETARLWQSPGRLERADPRSIRSALGTADLPTDLHRGGPGDSPRS